MAKKPARKKLKAKTAWNAPVYTAVVVLADGTVLHGFGVGATGVHVGEVCFNTAITGYQEILTDPSYAGQIITFTFPHIGNVGTNDEDTETTNSAAVSGVEGAIFKADITEPVNYRSKLHLDEWLKRRGIVGISGVDTRALTIKIREKGYINGVIAHNKRGEFDFVRLAEMAKGFAGLEGMDLAKEVSCTQRYEWDETLWEWETGFGKLDDAKHHVVAIDFGIKRNILRCLASLKCKVTVVPASSTAKDVLALKPDGIFLSNGPGDPAATGEYAAPEMLKLINSGIPVFGICLGHQIMALALGAKTRKMHQGHHGANHPVKDFTTGKVEITSMNHGFAVDADTLPKGVVETHVSLFDGSNCGLALDGKPVFSVQYHPEASPGPQDSHYLFDRFVKNIELAKAG
ncbi:Carbamoyl-phosphate synthase small chain [hydrothermal vent metagenome]|uniref:carbamoyl-phosphate synthase (glutamine-hydrolyzing) n=1 Tax=hydrothermal vent metagenome TaxID=652676 RepID=A0A3B0RN05_9ZZZZ